VKIIHLGSGAILAERVTLALTAWQRARGLLGTRTLPEGEALLLAPCNSVHTLGMRYPLYVLYLDGRNRVIWEGVLRPWRMGPYILRARRVNELPVSLAGNVKVGDVIGLAGGRPELDPPPISP